MSLTVKEVRIKNFKNLSNVELSLKGKSLIISGENGAGKSSFIQAIWSTLSAKGKPQKPIKEGEDNASVIVVIGEDGKEYTVESKFTEKGNYLTITSPDGFQTSKVGNLEKLVGDINFDIFNFVQLSRTVPGRREQVGMILDFLTPKEQEAIETINTDISFIKEERSGINVLMKNDSGTLATLKDGLSTDDIDLIWNEAIPEPVDKQKLLHDYQVTETNNNEIKLTQAGIDSNVKEHNILIKATETATEQMKKEIQELKARYASMATNRAIKISELSDVIKKMDKELSALGNHIDTDSIMQKIRDADTANDRIQSMQNVSKLQKSIETKKTKFSSLLTKMNAKEENKRKVITGSSLPVKGLTFDEDGLYFNGIPFTEEQLATSELIRIGIQIAMAKNPNVKILRIEQGESLGDKVLKEILAAAKKAGYQLFIEEVTKGKEQLQFKYIEE